MLDDIALCALGEEWGVSQFVLQTVLKGIFQGMKNSVNIKFSAVVTHQSYSKNLKIREIYKSGIINALHIILLRTL